MIFFGGPDGNMPKQTVNTQRDSATVMRRRIIRDAVTRELVQPTLNGRALVAAPSRAWANTDDYLSRNNYVCGGPTPSMPIGTPFSGMLRAAVQNCDGSGIPGANCNPKFVPDASSFGHYRAMWNITQTYNEQP